MTVVLVGFATNRFERKKLCKFFEDSPGGNIPFSLSYRKWYPQPS